MQRNKEKQEYNCKSLSKNVYMHKLLIWLINEKI